MPLPLIAQIGATALSSGAQIFQGIKAKKEQKRAEAAAERKLQEARDRISVNYAEGVRDVNLDAYNQQYEQTLAAQQQGLMALQGAGQRGVLAGVGQMQQQAEAQQERTRLQQQQELYQRDLNIMQEKKEDAQAMANLDLAEAEGAQIAAGQAQNMATQAFTGAAQGLLGGVTSIYENSDLYKKAKPVTPEVSTINSLGAKEMLGAQIQAPVLSPVKIQQ